MLGKESSANERYAAWLRGAPAGVRSHTQYTTPRSVHSELAENGKIVAFGIGKTPEEALTSALDDLG